MGYGYSSYIIVLIWNIFTSQNSMRFKPTIIELAEATVNIF